MAPPIWADSAVGIMRIAATAPIIESLSCIRLSPSRAIMAAAMQSWLQHKVAELRKELAAARAELHRLRAIDTKRYPDATLN